MYTFGPNTEVRFCITGTVLVRHKVRGQIQNTITISRTLGLSNLIVFVLVVSRVPLVHWHSDFTRSHSDSLEVSQVC